MSERILIFGSFSTFSFAIDLSNDKSNDGSNNKLESIARRRVPETKAPKATVPPKLETMKTENPKNKTIEV